MHGTLPATQALSAVIAEHAGMAADIRPHLSGAALHEVLDYWESLCGGRRFPARADFDPMAVRKHLPVIYLMDALADGSFRYRVVGEMISDFFGAGSPVGRTPQELFGDTAEVALAPYRRVCAEGCLYTHTASAVWLYKNRSYVHYQVLLLPMGDSEARVDKILAAVEFVAESVAAR